MQAEGAAAPGRPATQVLPTAPDDDAVPDFDVIILAGGRAARLGGVDKPGLVVGPATMAAAVADAAVRAGARRVVLVGPARADFAKVAAAAPGGLAVVREDPPGAGPVPALRAGLREGAAAWAAVLAADLPFLSAAHIRGLLAAASRDPDGAPGAVLVDDAGRAQWLAGCWHAAPLRAALAGYDGHSLRGLLGPLRPLLISWPVPPGEPPPWLDCDTPAELAAARAWLSRSHEPEEASR